VAPLEALRNWRAFIFMKQEIESTPTFIIVRFSIIIGVILICSISLWNKQAVTVQENVTNRYRIVQTEDKTRWIIQIGYDGRWDNIGVTQFKDPQIASNYLRDFLEYERKKENSTEEYVSVN
jgi:hypothetical protein